MSAPVSVIVPVYAVEKWLASCLDSLIAQTEPGWEAIVVIDGSPDSSEAIARDYASRDSRFRIVVRPQGGLGAARNTGLGEASGEYLAFLDSDDLLLPEAFELLLAAAREDDADVVLSAGDDLYADGSRSRYWTQRDALHRGGGSGLTAATEPAILLDHVAWAKLYRRSWFVEQGLRYPEGVHTEDLVPWAQAALRARRVSVISETTYLHRRHADSISADYLRPKTLRDWIGESLRAIRVVEEEGTPEALRLYLRTFVTGQWMTRGREYDGIGEQDLAVLLAEQAGILARLVRETGTALPPEVGGLLEAVAGGWAASAPRAPSGESANPMSAALGNDAAGIAERARRLRRLHATGRAEPEWERVVFRRLLVEPLSRLGREEAASVSGEVAAALRALYPGPRRLGLVAGRRARFGLVATGEWRSRRLLQRIVEERRSQQRKPATAVHRGRPVVYYPAWDANNPFLTMLHLEARGRMRETIGMGNYYRLTQWLRSDAEPALLHLHWTAPIIERGKTPAEADREVDDFLEALDARLARGSTLIWTLHNALPHDTDNEELGRRLHQALADRAEVIHVMTRGTQEAIGDAYTLPPEKVRYIPHASYHGVYGAPLPRDEARARLGVAEGSVAVLAFGLIRPYKGHDAIADAIIERHRAGQRLHLLLAGNPVEGGGADALLARLAEAGVPVTAHLGHVGEEEVAAWFSAADVVALPYTRILNSGTAMLAVAYGVPVIVTSSPGIAAEYAEEAWARLIAPERVQQELATSLAEEWYLAPGARDAALAFATRRSMLSMSVAYADLLDELDPSVG